MPRRPSSDDPSVRLIAANLRRTRDDLDISQGEAASRAGVQQSQLSRWEKAKQKPEVDQLVKMAAAYECSLDDLVSGVHDAYDALVEQHVTVDVKRSKSHSSEHRRRMAVSGNAARAR